MLSKKLLGNKEKFAIEYEIESTYKQFMYGKICYWIQEKQIGKYDDRETLSDILLFIPSIVRDNGNRKHERLFGLKMDKVIYLLSGAAFLDGNMEIEKNANEEQWTRFNISMPVNTFNDTYTFLIDSNEKSRVIFMDNKGECHQSFMDKGYIDKILYQLYMELNSFYEEICWKAEKM
ncbi:MAG: immunity 42 family protein [Lachnospiraceae bacterium]|nr:immunity 42 family protein [Lachnospiraceae bacterium]